MTKMTGYVVKGKKLWVIALGLLALMIFGGLQLLRLGGEVPSEPDRQFAGRQEKAALPQQNLAVSASDQPKPPFPIVVNVQHGEPEGAEDPDVEFLKRMGVGTDGPSLTKFLEDGSPADINPENLDSWIRQLGDKSFEKRQEASKKLSDIGLAALEPLRKTEKDRDPEVRRRAHQLVDRQEHDPYWGLPFSAVRHLIKQKPPGTLETLLRFLPFATWEELVEEIWYGIEGLRFKGGRLHPALMAALLDQSSARRAIAACIVAREGTGEQKKLAQRLLADTNPMVRLRTAQGFLAASDMRAVPVLIDLLNDPSVEISWQAEELLHWLAGNNGPDEIIGGATEQERQNCLHAWQHWWRVNKEATQSPHVIQRNRGPGLLLISDSNGAGDSHRVWLCGCDGRPRWKLENVLEPLQVQVLPGNRVFLASKGKLDTGSLQRIDAGLFVLDLTGKVVSKSSVFPGNSCRTLPNYSVASYSNRGLVVTTMSGNEILHYEPEHTYSTAEFLPQGALLEIDFPIVDGQAVKMRKADAGTGERIAISEFRVNASRAHFFHAAASADGTLLIWMASPDRLFELSCTSDRLRTVEIPGLWAACRLHDSTLVVSQSIGMESRIVEIDRFGKSVWEAFSKKSGVDQINRCFPLLRFGFEKLVLSASTIDSLAARIELLKSEDPVTRRWSATTLGTLQPRTNTAITALLDALLDPDQGVRICASTALVQIGKEAIPQIVSLLRSNNIQLRRSAIALLGSGNLLSRDLLTVFVKCLADDDQVIRKMAIKLIGEVATEERDILPAMRKALSDSAAEVRVEAIGLLPTIHSLGIDWESLDLLALDDPDLSVRIAGIISLERIGPDAGHTIPRLQLALARGDPQVQSAAANAMAKISPFNREVVTALVSLLRDSTSLRAKAGAAKALGRIGPYSKEAIPVLIDNLNVSHDFGREGADVRTLRTECIYALQRMGHFASDAVPQLLAIVESQDSDLLRERVPAVKALQAIGPSAKAACPALSALAKRPDLPEVLRNSIEDAIKTIQQR